MTQPAYYLADIAQIWGVTEKAVRGWIKQGLPVLKAGTQGGAREKTEIDLEAAARWYFESNLEKLELDRQRARLAEEQADKHALENAHRRGELLDVASVAKTWGDLFTAIRAHILALPTKTAAEVAAMTDANRIRERLTTEVHQILAEASAYQPRGAAKARSRGARPADGEHTHAAAGAHGKPVGGREPKAKPRKQRGAGKMANR